LLNENLLRSTGIHKFFYEYNQTFLQQHKTGRNDNSLKQLIAKYIGTKEMQYYLYGNIFFNQIIWFDNSTSNIDEAFSYVNVKPGQW